MKISVIISTYNHPKWLEKVLWGYQYQSYKDFELIIADDGSDEKTREVINRFQASSEFQINHCWHEDNGFQKTTILNRALSEVTSEYVMITDGDCIPREDFLLTHVTHAEPGYFLSGGYCKLSMDLSRLISHEDIRLQRCFDLGWMKSKGLRGFSQKLKIGLSNMFSAIADKITPTKATWNGMNSSGYIADLIAVNGFNEDMQYGGLDRELGERLSNLGIKSKQIRHRAVCLHLDHKRGYRTKETLMKNKARRQWVIEKKVIRCANGIEKLAEETTG